MAAHVKVQVMLVLEGFAAMYANLCLLLVVSQLVGRETCSRAEEFPALHALVGQLGRVYLLMAPQLAHTGERFSTLSASEDTVLGVSQLMLTQQVHFLKAFPTLGTVELMDAMTTPVSKFFLYRLKTIPTFDANISCICALRSSVSGHV